jgi:hypothetical protein
MSYPRNMANKIGEHIVSDDGENLLVIDPAWTDDEVLSEWVDVFSVEAWPSGTEVIRHKLYRYSAAQIREQQPEHAEYWGDDGELKTWMMVAEIGTQP